MLANAFKFLINLKGKMMTLEKADFSTSTQIKIAVSNYSRNLNTVEEVVVDGQEFVLIKEDLKDFGTPKRGDRIKDSEWGTKTISEVLPMPGLNGAIIGYRLRTS